VLEVGRRPGGGSDRDRIERAVPNCQREQRQSARPDLETAIRDVPVRHSVTEEMCERAQRDGPAARPGDGARHSARRDVERDDHRRGA